MIRNLLLIVIIALLFLILKEVRESNPFSLRQIKLREEVVRRLNDRW